METARYTMPRYNDLYSMLKILGWFHPEDYSLGESTEHNVFVSQVNEEQISEDSVSIKIGGHYCIKGYESKC